MITAGKRADDNAESIRFAARHGSVTDGFLEIVPEDKEDANGCRHLFIDFMADIQK